MKVEVIDSFLFAEREMYVLDIDGKRTMVYKSSGLSGTGHGGEFLPFMYLCEGRGLDRIRYSPGYIYKEFYYDNKYRHHGKEMYKYIGVPEFLETLEDLTPRLNPNDDLFYQVTDEYDDNDEALYDVIWDLAESINKRLKLNIEGYEPFDWYTLGE